MHKYSIDVEIRSDLCEGVRGSYVDHLTIYVRNVKRDHNQHIIALPTIARVRLLNEIKPKHLPLDFCGSGTIIVFIFSNKVTNKKNTCTHTNLITLG